MWEETGAPGRNPHDHRENVHTPRRQHTESRSNLGLWRCEVAALPVASLCCPGAGDIPEKSCPDTNVQTGKV